MYVLWKIQSAGKKNEKRGLGSYCKNIQNCEIHWGVMNIKDITFFPVERTSVFHIRLPRIISKNVVATYVNISIRQDVRQN